MKLRRFGQQGIVFAVFAALFALFSVVLPGFATTDNMLTLLQNVAVLGILGLAMAIVVIGRGIDISLIAALAVPPGLVLQMVQDGHSLPTSLAAAFAADDRVRSRQRLADRLCRGAVAVHDAGDRHCSSPASARPCCSSSTSCSGATGSTASSGSGRARSLGVPMPIVMFAIACVVVAFLLRRTRSGAYIYAIGDNPNGARVTGIPTRPIIVLQYVLAALIGCFAGLVLAASVNTHADAHLQFDADLRRDPRRRARRHRAVGRPRRRRSTSSSARC